MDLGPVYYIIYGSILAVFEAGGNKNDRSLLSAHKTSVKNAEFESKLNKLSVLANEIAVQQFHNAYLLTTATAYKFVF